MQTLGDMAKELNRSTLYLQGLQKRFELPLFESDEYPDTYLAFLRTVTFLRIMGVSEESLLELWHFEKKLMRLLHADVAGSLTWALDSCGQTKNGRRRLLLSNYDLGVDVPSGALQLGLDFTTTPSELFSGREMGEDAIRVLTEYVKLYTHIRSNTRHEATMVNAALRWEARH
jgi:hypothetical protein